MSKPVEQNHGLLLALAIVMQVIAAIAWAPASFGCLLVAAGAGGEFMRDGNIYDRILRDVMVVSLPLINWGWPTLGVLSWVQYRKARRIRRILVISCLPLVHIAVMLGVVMARDWLKFR